MRKNIKLLILLALLTACSPLNNFSIPDKSAIRSEVTMSVKPSASVVVSPVPKESVSVVPSSDVLNLQSSGKPEVTAIPSPSPTISSGGSSNVVVTPQSTPTPSSSSFTKPPNNLSGGPSGDNVTETTEEYLKRTGTSYVRYDVNYDVDPNLKKGYISVVFKDDYKVRYYFKDMNDYEKRFVSMSGKDMSNINKIATNYKLTAHISNNYSKLTQEEIDKIEADAAEAEKKVQDFSYYEVPNRLSIYGLENMFEEMNMKEVIEKLRADPSVLSANIE